MADHAVSVSRAGPESLRGRVSRCLANLVFLEHDLEGCPDCPHCGLRTLPIAQWKGEGSRYWRVADELIRRSWRTRQLKRGVTRFHGVIAVAPPLRGRWVVCGRASHSRLPTQGGRYRHGAAVRPDTRPTAARFLSDRALAPAQEFIDDASPGQGGAQKDTSHQVPGHGLKERRLPLRAECDEDERQQKPNRLLASAHVCLPHKPSFPPTCCG